MQPRLLLKGNFDKLQEMHHIEKNLHKKGYLHLAGVDEAGRGPLAGPVVAAAVILPPGLEFEGLDDSKKLSAAQRERLFDEIVSSDAVYDIGIIDNDIIDHINILRASLRAMSEAVNKMKIRPDFVLVDGNQTIPNLDLPQMAMVGGDGLCPSISAASILAKVTRDRIMDRYAEIYPDFNFSRHKGYATREHLQELKICGPSAIHRRSFRPIQEMISQVEMPFA